MREEKEAMDVFKQICQLFHITSPKGYKKEEVEAAKMQMGGMPKLLEQFYLEYGLCPELQDLQDELILPNRYSAFLPYDYLVFFDENQGVCQAGIHKGDLNLPNPPVFVYHNEVWIKSSDTFTEFLSAMFGYQASICLPYSPEEFYFITEEEAREIERLFGKRTESIRNWIVDDITLYNTNEKGRIALMESKGWEIQLNYAANDQQEFDRMAFLLKDIGEAI